MKRIILFKGYQRTIFGFFRCSGLSSLLGCVVGSIVALFLSLLDSATRVRWQHPGLIFLLPLAGMFIHLLYKTAGKHAERGNNLVIDEIHQPGGGVPARMAPLVLLTTLITHLFGGSAGREGTAVQIGGSTASWLSRLCRVPAADRPVLLMAGIAAGFGAVFGTPVSGAVFAMEVIAIGSIRYEAIGPCLAAAIVADSVCSRWGIHHAPYRMMLASATVPQGFDRALLVKAGMAGVAFGLAANIFARTAHAVGTLSRALAKAHTWMIPFVGGLLIILLTLVIGSEDYLGLGVMTKDGTGSSIINAFHAGGVAQSSWCWKLLFTAITLGTGFKGGEVTPLFFIGATLGNTLALVTGAPVALFAALGFIAVFAGATNTPLASTIMGVELFGGEHLLYFAVACIVAYYFSGRTGIYTAQRTVVGKYGYPWRRPSTGDKAPDSH